MFILSQHVWFLKFHLVGKISNLLKVAKITQMFNLNAKT